MNGIVQFISQKSPLGTDSLTIKKQTTTFSFANFQKKKKKEIYAISHWEFKD